MTTLQCLSAIWMTSWSDIVSSRQEYPNWRVLQIRIFWGDNIEVFPRVTSWPCVYGMVIWVDRVIWSTKVRICMNPSGDPGGGRGGGVEGGGVNGGEVWGEVEGAAEVFFKGNPSLMREYH